jgi:3-isopropylmalate/(R)-2-methylmalate dehydratase small subunit
MRPLPSVSGRVAVLDRADVDTDQIIPQQFLKRIERAGYGEFLFFDWMKDPAFELHAVADASILIAGRNFGCGSSREHAVWALADYGFRAVIAPSFADIFYNNCFKNGVLPIALPAETVDGLFAAAAATPGYALQVDLAAQEVATPDGARHRFAIDEFRKHCLLNGLDEIGLTLEHRAEIAAYEERRRRAAPWLFTTPADTR